MVKAAIQLVPSLKENGSTTKLFDTSLDGLIIKVNS